MLSYKNYSRETTFPRFSSSFVQSVLQMPALLHVTGSRFFLRVDYFEILHKGGLSRTVVWVANGCSFFVWTSSRVRCSELIFNEQIVQQRQKRNNKERAERKYFYGWLRGNVWGRKITAALPRSNISTKKHFQWKCLFRNFGVLF